MFSQLIVEIYTQLTSLQIFEGATSLRIFPGGATTQGNVSKEETPEVATRIVYIGILHWRAWSPLAYLVGLDAEGIRKS